ncbi:MAG: DNA alkylation repair protein [Candidatus Kapaibacterium sp.]
MIKSILRSWIFINHYTKQPQLHRVITMSTPSEKFLLKDHLFNKQKVAFLAERIYNVHPQFNVQQFKHDVLAEFPQLELKQRITHISTCLQKHLPDSYPTAVHIICNALPEPLDESLTDNDFGDFIYAPFGEFVARYGCTSTHLTISLQALKEITKRFSTEFAIRFFINAFPQETMAELSNWCNDSNYHVRRLCSEGTRPSLPWAQKVTLDTKTTLPILTTLFADSTRYVTRSVANHLNDISKTEPQVVLDTLSAWKNSGKQQPEEMDFIIKHALRTLVKQGNPEALRLLGFGNSNHIQLHNVQHSTTVLVGNALEFSFEITSKQEKSAIVDYILTFTNKQGITANKKVFKLKTLSLQKNTPVVVTKRHPLRANMTTRQLYPGTHTVDIQVNGTVLHTFSFELVM